MSVFADLLSQRIIPAYAGNTFARTVEELTVEDHPRLCGEHAFLRRRSV